MQFTELAQLINLNSHTKNKLGVDENGKIFQQWMQKIGYSTTVFPREHIGDHLLFTSPYQPEKPRLLLLGHLDTVFPVNTFSDFSEDEEWIYGPGVCDMKGGNYIALQALRNINMQHGSIQNIDMLLVSDEETGSDDSKMLSSKLAKDYDICLVFEAAGRDHEVVIGRKGVGTYHIKLTGKAAHAGNHYQDGANANLAAAKMLIKLTELTNLSLGSTVNAGKMQGGIGANTISPNAEISVEIRYTQFSEKQRLVEALQRIVNNPEVAGVSSQLSGGIQRDVMEPNQAQQHLLKQFEKILCYPLKTEQRGGVSDANILSASGVTTIDGFGPFGDGDHTIKERALKSSFKKRIDEVTKILAAYNVGK